MLPDLSIIIGDFDEAVSRLCEYPRCTCPPYCPSLWDADPSCPAHGADILAEQEAEAAAEIAAENAWRRHEENVCYFYNDPYNF